MEERIAKTITYRCPNCTVCFSMRGEAFPFCSARCKLIDLGAWASESYRISRKNDTETLDDSSEAQVGRTEGNEDDMLTDAVGDEVRYEFDAGDDL